MGYSPRGRKESDTTERLHFHFHFPGIMAFTRLELLGVSQAFLLISCFFLGDVEDVLNCFFSQSH